MRKLIIAAIATTALFGVAACESQADKTAEVQADALEAKPPPRRTSRKRRT